jgi:ankyrin repeat protein
MKYLTLACSLLLASATAHAQAPLATLIQNGERAAALEAIHAPGTDVNATQGDGTTALHWAVYKVDRELVAELLDHGAKADVTNKYGSSPLAEAAKLGDADLVRRLLDAGANVEAPNGDGQTALMLAAHIGALDVAKLLVERGADVNAKEAWRDQTSLIWAVDGNYPELTQFLIDNGADVNVRASANDWGSQITAEPRAQYRPVGGLTPLLYAARAGCTRCVRSLLAAGADIDRPTPEGMTPLMIAIDNQAYDTARLLLDEGANPHVWDWYGRTALYVAVDMASFRGRPSHPGSSSETSANSVIQMLLDAGVNPNPQLNMHRPSRGGNIGRFADELLNTGTTPLLRAAIGADVETARLLLAHGALVDLPSVHGITPLMAAAGHATGRGFGDARPDPQEAQARAIELIDMFLAAGADINAKITDDSSRTANVGRQPNSVTERKGQTALYGAVKNGWASVVEHLLERGADPKISDALGRTPVDAALGRIAGRNTVVSEEIAAILRAAGAKEGSVAAR